MTEQSMLDLLKEYDALTPEARRDWFEIVMQHSRERSARLEEAEEIIATLAHATYPEEINTAIGEAKDYLKCTS